MMSEVEDQYKGWPRVVREMATHKIIGNDFELRSNLLVGEPQGCGEYFLNSTLVEITLLRIESFNNS